MAILCKPLGNLGVSQCGFPLKVARRLIYVPILDANGDYNQLTMEEAALLASWTPKFDAANPLDRYYPLPNMENVEDVRADTEFFTWESGQKYKIRQGERTFIGRIPNETPSLYGRLQEWEGQQFGVYVIDNNGNLVFDYASVELDPQGAPGVFTDMARPIAVDGNSVDNMFIKPTYTDPEQIMVQFDFAQEVNDKNLYLIPAANLDYDGRTQDFYSLWDVYSSNEVWTVTASYETDLALEYSVPAAGFIIDDFLYDGAAVTDMTVAELPIGTYTFTAGVTDTMPVGTVISLSKTHYAPWVSTIAV